MLPCTAAIYGTTSDFADVSGSGFLIDKRGHIVTNRHVVHGLAAPLWVQPVGTARQHAALVGADPLTDLAVLQMADAPSRCLELRAEPAQPGALCLAFGSPLGEYPESISLGIVSGTGRSVPQEIGRPLEGLIQTDAAVNPGNSGGPLVDVHGRVIGVNTCSRSDASAIAFAVPAETVEYVVGEIIDHGEVRRAALGASVAARLVDIEGASSRRLQVTRVAARTQLNPGDVILSVAGHDVRSLGDLFRIMRSDYIGKRIDIDVLREGKRKTVAVTPKKLEPKE